MNETWGIIGLGWLGEELGNYLKSRSISFWGTHRSSFNFQTDTFPENPCDVLFLNTPPLVEISPEEFVTKIKFQGKKIIFISSTSVFSQTSGKFTEKDRPLPTSPSAIWLKKVEDLIQQRWPSKYIIIRPGGLIGGKRHPIFSLQGRENLSGAGTPVNLIHRLDLIEIIFKVSQQNDFQLIHAVAPYHPTRKEYYQWWAQELKLKLPTFTDEEKLERVIDSDVTAQLALNWKCPKLDFL